MLTAGRVDALRASLNDDLLLFTPELVVSGGVVLLLVCRLVPALDRLHLGSVALAVLVAGLVAAVVPQLEPGLDASRSGAVPFFGGMLAHDPFGDFVRVVLLAAAALTVGLTLLTGIPDRDDSGDFCVLLLGGTLGMLLMAQVNHLLMVFIAVEMASLPSYALAGFLKGRRQGSEAALKYVVFGAGASGVMLYGISLLAGTFGTGSLPQLAAAVNAKLSAGGGFDPLVLTGFTLLLVGFGFKLAAVPFHFWCPDVFEGAPAEVAGFLSVASKAAAVALTVRVLQTFDLGPGWRWVGLAVGVVGAVTVTFGNLAAFGQTNLKRLLAYSTIAHAGTMLLGVAVLSPDGTAAVLYYLVAYLAMNLGAFAVVALVRNRTGSEELSAVRGLVWRSPVAAVAMAVFLFSLLGFPPLAGFAGKFQVFAAVYEAGRGGFPGAYALLGVGVLNTALAAYYYLKVVREMVLEDGPSPAEASAGLTPGASVYLAALAALVVALGVVWNPLTAAADRAAATFTRTTAR
ncbi:MAG: NADH-quinone oxidoreductase subunit N [Gemmataceae bacterium]|nr:NADH-quinone oxidoreductase subunit N [Gemmataceae bacterium]